MATIDSTLSSLSAIRTKVRRLTRSPSTSQLTDDQIDDYVNTFVLYDFPEFTLDKKLTFYVMPNVDGYGNNTVNADDPLYNFINISLSVQNPVYVAGQEVILSQSREQFYRQYPKYNYEANIGSGDGATVAFSGTLSDTPALARTVMFNSIDANGDGLVVSDVPRTDVATGFQTQIGDIVVPNSAASIGTINYLTGVYSFTFPTAPAASEDVTVQAFRYTTGRPRAVLFEDNKFTFRPVPDKAYRVQLDTFKRPTELLADADEPEISQWWQYIAYGACKKVFEDRMDVESVDAIMPEFMRQRSLVLRRLVVQQTGERTATIYTERGAGFYVDKDFF